jgi:hypothetical protein
MPYGLFVPDPSAQPPDFFYQMAFLTTVARFLYGRERITPPSLRRAFLDLGVNDFASNLADTMIAAPAGMAEWDAHQCRGVHGSAYTSGKNPTNLSGHRRQCREPGGGVASETKEQPHALTHAPGATMPSADAPWQPVPVAGDEERSLPDARRNVTGRAERE